jgi:hypothetical protein
MDTTIPANHQLRRSRKRMAALSSVMAAIGLTVMKTLVRFTGSLGISSEAAHSGLTRPRW